MDQEFQSRIERLDSLTKLTLNDNVQIGYLQVGNKLLKTLGYKEKAYLAGSTVENTKLTTSTNEGDVDVLFVTGKFEVSQEELHEAGFPGYVWIRATDITKNLGIFELFDDEFISAKTLREVKPELFSFLNSFYALQTAAEYETPDHIETSVIIQSKVGISTNYYKDLSFPNQEGHIKSASESHLLKSEDNNKLKNVQPYEHGVQMIRRYAKALRILLQPGGRGSDKSRLSFYAEALDEAITQTKWGDILTFYPPPKEKQKLSSNVHDSNKPSNVRAMCAGTKHVDFVAAVRIKGEIDRMESWEKRVVGRNWPPAEVKKEVCLSEVFLVARESPQNPNIQKHFCLSFNQAEGILVRNFSNDQRHVYLLMKAYLKGTFINMFKKEKRDLKVKTFHVKTLLFWSFETQMEDLSENIPNILGKFLQFFREKMIERNLSHYFIPDANLLCEFEEEDYRIAIKCIDTVSKDPLDCLEDFLKLDDEQPIVIELTPEEIACLVTLSNENGKSVAINSFKNMLVEWHRGLHKMTRGDNGKMKEAIIQAFKKYLDLREAPPILGQFDEKQLEKIPVLF